MATAGVPVCIAATAREAAAGAEVVITATSSNRPLIEAGRLARGAQPLAARLATSTAPAGMCHWETGDRDEPDHRPGCEHPAAEHHRAGRRRRPAGHLVRPAPPSCNGCSTCSPTGTKERHLVADHSTDGAWDLIVTPWHLDEHIPAFPIPAAATQVIRPVLPSGPVPARMSLLHRAAVDAVTRAARPLVLSGDCPTARAAVAGLQRRHRDLAVLWLDAHGDFNTPAISTSGYLGGMALAMLTGRTPGLFDDTLGLRPVPDTSVVLADARDLDPAERDALTTSHVRRVPADPAAITSALGQLGPAPVYLHLDIDVIDSAQLPGARFPSGPGPSLAQIEECLAAACATANITAAYIACAWLPEHVSDQTSRQTITRLTAALGASLAWHEPAGS